MVILYMVFLLPLTIDAYHLAGYDHYCSVPSTRIRTRADCQAAATALGLNWGNGWHGPWDFAGCLYTKDSRQKVYFNYSPFASSTPNNPNYAEICTGPGLPKHYGLVITGGDDPQRQKLSELVSHLGICGSPNIPDLPNAISAGKSVWFEDRLMFCGGSDIYIGGMNDPTGWGAIDTCLKTKPGDTDWESDPHMNDKRSWFSLNINEKNNGVPTVVAAGGLDPQGNIWNTLEQYKKGQWHKMTNITLNYKVFGHCGVQYIKDGSSWLMLIAGSNKFDEWWDPTNRVTLINLDNDDQVDVVPGVLPALWAPACTIHGENIYVTGGGTKSSTLNTADPTFGVYIYNIHTGMFTESTGVLNVPRWGHTMGVTAKNQLVVAGGWNGTRLTSVEVSEDGGDTWKEWSTVLSKGAEYTAMASVPIEYLMCQ